MSEKEKDTSASTTSTSTAAKPKTPAKKTTTKSSTAKDGSTAKKSTSSTPAKKKTTTGTTPAKKKTPAKGKTTRRRASSSSSSGSSSYSSSTGSSSSFSSSSGSSSYSSSSSSGSDSPRRTTKKKTTSGTAAKKKKTTTSAKGTPAKSTGKGTKKTPAKKKPSVASSMSSSSSDSEGDMDLGKPLSTVGSHKSRRSDAVSMLMSSFHSEIQEEQAKWKKLNDKADAEIARMEAELEEQKARRLRESQERKEREERIRKEQEAQSEALKQLAAAHSMASSTVAAQSNFDRMVKAQMALAGNVGNSLSWLASTASKLPSWLKACVRVRQPEWKTGVPKKRKTEGKAAEPPKKREKGRKFVGGGAIDTAVEELPEQKATEIASRFVISENPEAQFTIAPETPVSEAAPETPSSAPAREAEKKVNDSAAESQKKSATSLQVKPATGSPASSSAPSPAAAAPATDAAQPTPERKTSKGKSFLAHLRKSSSDAAAEQQDAKSSSPSPPSSPSDGKHERHGSALMKKLRRSDKGEEKTEKPKKPEEPKKAEEPKKPDEPKKPQAETSKTEIKTPVASVAPVQIPPTNIPEPKPVVPAPVERVVHPDISKIGVSCVSEDINHPVFRPQITRCASAMVISNTPKVAPVRKTMGGLRKLQPGHVIVVDNGSSYIKAGAAGEDIPRASIPTVVGYLDDSCYVGRPALLHDGLDLNNPIHPSKDLDDVDWDALGDIWEYTFCHELRIDPTLHPFLMTELPLMAEAARAKIAELMFESFEAPALHIANPAVLSLYAKGKVTGLAVDCGNRLQIVPVVDGFAVGSAVFKTRKGFAGLTEYLAKLLGDNKHATISSSKDMEACRRAKEAHCYVSQEFEKEYQLAEANPNDYARKFELPDGSVVEMTHERFVCPEAMFQPRLLDLDMDGVHEMLWKSVNKCAIDDRKPLLGNIILTGGSTLFPGFSERLQQEILNSASERGPSNLRRSDIRISAPKNRKYLSWFGGAVLGSLDQFVDNNCLFREQYLEDGSV